MDGMDMQKETFLTYQKKKVHVVLEFPEQSDKGAEEEFVSRLKEIYLRKVKSRVQQECKEP